LATLTQQSQDIHDEVARLKAPLLRTREQLLGYEIELERLSAEIIKLESELSDDDKNDDDKNDGSKFSAVPLKWVS
jgi:predicted  nucleic acid-binding Zn-ribbon protein